MRVLVEGLCRCRVERFAWSSDYYTVRVSPIEDKRSGGAEVEALMRHVLAQFNEYVHLNRRIPDEVLTAANNMTDPVTLAHTVAAHLLVKVAQKQRLLEVDGELERLKLLGEILSSELEIVKLERKIEGQVRSQVHKNQKEFYLNEQLKAIRKELGHQNEFASEIDEVGAAIKKARMPREVVAKAMKELDRLSKMSFMSPEATVVRNYLDWLVSLPWSRVTRDHGDLDKVQAVLDEDHYGLRKIKERIVEYLAVLKLTGQATRVRSCASSDRRASARPRSASRSPARSAAASCAWRWAACATRPRSAAIAAPISARCPAASSRACAAPAAAIRCSCSTRSTSWALISAAIRLRRCSRCSIPSRTTPSTITISRWTSTCRR